MTSSKTRVNLASRSRTRNRNSPARSPRSSNRFRACWADPCTARVGGHAQDVDEPAPDLDHEEDVQAAQQRGIDREEITCQRAGRVSADEVAPPAIGTPRCRTRPGALQDPADRRAADPVSELRGSARTPRRSSPGPASAPAPQSSGRSVACPACAADRSICGRPAAGASARACTVSPADSSAAPSAAPWPTRTRSRTIGPRQLRPIHLTTKDGDLMTQHQDLQFLRRIATSQQRQPADHPAEDQIHQALRHDRRGRPTPATSSSTWHHRRSQPRSRVMTPFKVRQERPRPSNALE